MTHPEDPPFVDLCGVGDLAEGEARAFQARGRGLLLCRRGREVFAVAGRCTHAAWDLAGSEVRDDEIVCSLHGARFDLRTGEATARPASKPLATYPVRIRGDRVQVQVPPVPR